jgi:hypothetical protein
MLDFTHSDEHYIHFSRWFAPIRILTDVVFKWQLFYFMHLSAKLLHQGYENQLHPGPFVLFSFLVFFKLMPPLSEL